MSDATIFARATGAGRAAITILRVSGPKAGPILEAIAGRLPPPRLASLRTLRQGTDVLDHAVVLWLPGPRSYTGEDGFELHLHAGPAIEHDVADALVMLGARPAEAGEFTRRAFTHGRIDLLQAEAIADLIEAETSAQRRQALTQGDGALSRLYDDWAQRLRTILAHQEALIDFPDEDLPPEVEARLLTGIADLRAEMDAHLNDGHRGELVRRGISIVIAGAPNAGKSSLLNVLAGRDAAIVTDRAGTTRDAISVTLELGGQRAVITDTAGLRETEDAIEAEGIRRAMFHVKQADLVVHLYTEPDRPAPLADVPVEDVLTVCNKTDLHPAPDGVLGISATTGAGLGALQAELAIRVTRLTHSAGAAPLTRARHRAGITEARDALAEAERAAWPELRGEALRVAMRALGRLTGVVGVEDLLETVFGSFCIGK